MFLCLQSTSPSYHFFLFFLSTILFLQKSITSQELNIIDYILYGFHLRERSRTRKSVKTDSGLGLLGDKESVELGVTEQGWVSFGGDGEVLELDSGDDCTTLGIY